MEPSGWIHRPKTILSPRPNEKLLVRNRPRSFRPTFYLTDQRGLHPYYLKWCSDRVEQGESLHKVSWTRDPCIATIGGPSRSEQFPEDFSASSGVPTVSTPPSQTLFQMRRLLAREHRPDL
ncbi:hypothetical protein LBMAG56_06240 [Verrucomicrobiota bacterium]|nr:hypothetical protein LBMAG56_06240 [Verrucomicrobiota bacterium]